MMQIQIQYEFDKKESLAKAEQAKKDALALKEIQKQKLFRNALIGGFALLLILGAIISIIMIQRREIRGIKKERTRISGELHDDIGADLNRITMISQLLYKKTNKDKEMQEKLLNISEAGKKVLGNIGEIIWTMNPQKDNLESLVAYIRRFVTEYLEMNRIEVDFIFPDEIPERSVSDEYRRNIFLVIKEAIYNITKYSKATRVQLSMNLDKKMAGIEIHDNGTGFSVKEKQNWGNGLTNMNQRMKDIRGNFRISSGKDQGTLINLNFPVR
jgi:signal transduction histidine kinase